MTRRSGSVIVTVATVAMTVVGVLGLTSCGGKDEQDVPLTQEQLVARGRQVYAGTCATCHGDALKGSSMAPSLLQAPFAPDQTPDSAFANAIQNGVPQKRFAKGPMPAQPSVAPKDIPAVVAYVRSVQRDNGIGGPGAVTSPSTSPSSTATSQP